MEYTWQGKFPYLDLGSQEASLH